MQITIDVGWICPQCQRVWAPSVTACSPCNDELENAPDNATLDTSIDVLRLPARPTHALVACGAKTLRDVIELSAGELFRHKNVGQWSVRQIREALAELGLSLKGEHRRLRSPLKA